MWPKVYVSTCSWKTWVNRMIPPQIHWEHMMWEMRSRGKADHTSLGIADSSDSEVELLKVAGQDCPSAAVPQPSSAACSVSDGTGTAVPSLLILKHRRVLWMEVMKSVLSWDGNHVKSVLTCNRETSRGWPSHSSVLYSSSFFATFGQSDAGKTPSAMSNHQSTC